MPLLRTVAVVVCLAWLTPYPVAAQTPPAEPLPGLELSLTNPGARSLGFGGAFVALADDATAAFANPAGLVQLIRPELSAEGRVWSYPGGGPGLPGLGFADDVSAVGFFSFVYPVGRWSFAVYVHQLAILELPGGSPGLLEPLVNAWFSDLSVANIGVSGAYSVSETVSLGLGLTSVQGSFAAAGWSLPASARADGRYAPWQADAATTSLVTADANASDMGFIAGLLWSVSDRWSLGASLRPGPELRFDVVGADPLDLLQAELPVVFPDLLAVGAAFRSRDGRYVVSFEWDSLRGTDAGSRNRLHVGAEYAFLRSTPAVGVRLGAWLDPAVGSRGFAAGSPAAALLPVDGDELHLAAGVGVAFRRLQLDLGFDESDLVDTVSVSMIYSF